MTGGGIQWPVGGKVNQAVELERTEELDEQQVRETELSSGASEEVSDSDEESPSMRGLLPTHKAHREKKVVVVLDLDETLVRFREGPVFWRPCFEALLDEIKHVCEVVLWTASTERCASRIMPTLDPLGDRLHHHIYRSDLWFTGVPYTKDLTLLGRDMSKVLIIENTPQCVFKNPSNAIIVEDYIVPNNADRHLHVVKDIILEMAKHDDLHVPTFLHSSPLVDTVPGTDSQGFPMNFHLPSTSYMSSLNTDC